MAETLPSAFLFCTRTTQKKSTQFRAIIKDWYQNTQNSPSDTMPAFPGDDGKKWRFLKKRFFFFFLKRFLPGPISSHQLVFWRCRAPAQARTAFFGKNCLTWPLQLDCCWIPRSETGLPFVSTAFCFQWNQPKTPTRCWALLETASSSSLKLDLDAYFAIST